MRSLYLFAFYISFFVLGLNAPFVFSLGYVWVDTFDPQHVSYSILNSMPISMIIAAASIFSYVISDKKYAPRVNFISILILLFAAWSTLSLSWAVVPSDAYYKWSIVWKTLAFSLFVPFVFRSRIQIESFLQVYV